MWPLLDALRWQMEWMQRGKVPETTHTGEPWGRACTMDPGSDLKFSTVLLYVKGDLAEFSHTLGLQSWKSSLSPCCFCSLPLADVFDEDIGGVDAWPEKTHDDYDRACKQCEIEVQLATPDDVLRLVNSLSWQKSQARIGGRVVACEIKVSGKQLMPGDRLEPNEHLWDIGSLEKIRLPSQVIFWRSRLSLEAQPKVIDAVHHRNPLFSQSLFSSPHNTLCVDILHSVYLGPVMRFCGAAVQRILLKKRLQHGWELAGKERIEHSIAQGEYGCVLRAQFRATCPKAQQHHAGNVWEVVQIQPLGAPLLPALFGISLWPDLSEHVQTGALSPWDWRNRVVIPCCSLNSRIPPAPRAQ